ncbi:MAG: hypothetical protein ABW159_18730, partial [Candidatus Thiodiazotropha sp.]
MKHHVTKFATLKYCPRTPALVKFPLAESPPKTVRQTEIRRRKLGVLQHQGVNRIPTEHGPTKGRVAKIHPTQSIFIVPARLFKGLAILNDHLFLRSPVPWLSKI